MNVFIVHAHPERKSFNAAMTARAIDTFVDHGDHVTVSDLYAMNFDPVSDRRNFRGTADGAFLSIQNEELHAVQGAGFAVDLAAEMNKLPPAIC